jgi:large subunit ribosomal protein L20
VPRVKRGTGRRDYRHKTLRRAKGFFLTKSKLNRSAQEAVEKALRYGYVGRRLKKRNFRSLWIVRINAKVLADIAINDAPGFQVLVARAKAAHSAQVQ